MAGSLPHNPENFAYNSMLARGLMQLIPTKDRSILQLWLQKLHNMDSNQTELNIRSEYMWFLLMQLQNKQLTDPFKSYPPTHRLRPLREILQPDVYEDVLVETENNMSWLETADKEVEEEDKKSDTTSNPPCQFLQNQPMPKNGIICYFAAFSDQNY